MFSKIVDSQTRALVEIARVSTKAANLMGFLVKDDNETVGFTMLSTYTEGISEVPEPIIYRVGEDDVFIFALATANLHVRATHTPRLVTLMMYDDDNIWCRTNGGLCFGVKRLKHKYSARIHKAHLQPTSLLRLNAALYGWRENGGPIELQENILYPLLVNHPAAQMRKYACLFPLGAFERELERVRRDFPVMWDTFKV